MNAIISTALLGVIMMFLGVFSKNKQVPHIVAILGLLGILAVNIAEYASGHPLVKINVHGMLSMGLFSLVFISISLLATLYYFLLNGSEIQKVGAHVAEYYALIFFVLCGVSIAATFNTLLMLFVGVEIMSIPLYILTGSDKRNLKSNEAALKYFLMGAFSTGILLMGVAFLYGGNPLASFYLDKLALGVGPLSVFTAVGLLFTLIALSFKVSAAPFHFWTPDVYDGAPTVFTAFMSTIVKAAGFIAFIRLFEISFGLAHDQWQLLVALIAAATLFFGNITAVFQQSVKRMLAYSSIAQAGFMMLAIFALNKHAKEGLLLYSAAYSVATIGLFAILSRMEDFTIDGFNGLAKTNPSIALAALVFLCSLTGIPLTAGFQSKFMLLMATVEHGQLIWLVVFAVLMAAVSAYYYFRVIQAMYFKEPANPNQPLMQPTNSMFRFWLMVGVALILIIGIYPELVIGWIYR
jgi:NADH-quinone oxidoreductase subunit N